MTSHAERALGTLTLTPPEDDERRSGEAEEHGVQRDDVAEDLLVASADRDHRRPDALQHDGHHRRARSLRQTTNGLEKDSIPRHGVVHPWRGEHALAQKPNGGDRDAGRDESCTGTT